MQEIKETLLNVLCVAVFLLLHISTFSASLWISKLYSSFFDISDYNFHIENTVAIVCYSFFLFAIYGTMIIVNKSRLVNELLVKILIGFVVSAMMIMLAMIFILDMNYVIVFSSFIFEFAILYFIFKFEWYKVKIFYYNSSYYKTKNKISK